MLLIQAASHVRLQKHHVIKHLVLHRYRRHSNDVHHGASGAPF